MPDPGLRERKKARTRRRIADVAAQLFAEHGYERVAVSDIARHADVAEQTVYNYFQTKEQLVTDRDQHVQDRLAELIRTRAPGVGAAAAVRDFVLAFVDGILEISPEAWRGELGYLAAVSPAVHRLSLEMADRQAGAVAAAIGETTAIPAEVAELQGIALAGVFQVVIGHAGRRTVQGASQAEVVRELRPMVERLLDELDRWLAEPTPAPGR